MLIFLFFCLDLLHLGNFNHSFQPNNPVVYPAHIFINTI